MLVCAAFTELRSLPYFDVRLKLQTFLMLFVLTIFMLTILLACNTASNSVLVSSLTYLQLLPFTHFSSSSATFLSVFSIVNIYICACAYYYRPSLNQPNGKQRDGTFQCEFNLNNLLQNFTLFVIIRHCP